MRQNCHDSNIRHTFIYDIGGGGIKIGQTSQPAEGEDVSSGIRVENCILRHLGQTFPCAAAILEISSSSVPSPSIGFAIESHFSCDIFRFPGSGLSIWMENRSLLVIPHSDLASLTVKTPRLPIQHFTMHIKKSTS